MCGCDGDNGDGRDSEARRVMRTMMNDDENSGLACNDRGWVC